MNRLKEFKDCYVYIYDKSQQQLGMGETKPSMDYGPIQQM